MGVAIPQSAPSVSRAGSGQSHEIALMATKKPLDEGWPVYRTATAAAVGRALAMYMVPMTLLDWTTTRGARWPLGMASDRDQAGSSYRVGYFHIVPNRPCEPSQ